MSASAAAPAMIPTKRVNFILSERAHADLTNVAETTHRSMTDVVRLGVGLVKIALEASRNGHRLMVTTAEGVPLREIVLPE